MSDGIPINVKWGKESFSFKLMVDGGVRGLKAELEERTGVPSDRMKLMPKSKGLWKGVLKDDFDLASIDFAAALEKTSGKELQILLMGSATKLAGPKTKTVFIEDLPPEEAAKHIKEPSGLVNLGNTCYLNSVVQCLRSVPQLRQGLTSYTPSSRSGGDQMMASGMGVNQTNGMFVSSLRDLFASLDRTPDATPPSNFVRATRMAFPQFAQTGPQGQPMQQDAEEFLSGLLTIAATETNGNDNIKKGLPSITEKELDGASNLIDAVFGMKMEETLTCDEFSSTNAADTSSDMQVDDKESNDAGAAAAPPAASEPPVTSYDLHRKLVCNIQGGSDGASQTNVNHIAEGLALSLSGKIEKHSDVLGRDAVWSRKQKIARLPPVIVVQFGRFYWKQTPDSQDHAGVKCKVMKPVAFSGTLDIYEFCTEKLQKVLKTARDRALAEEEDRINKKLKGEIEAKKTTEGSNGNDDKMETDETPTAGGGEPEEEDEELKAALAMSVQEELEPVGPGLPKDFQGVYELFGVVTHKGRDADGGHYMGWVKAENSGSKVKKIADTDEDDEDWFVFDDDEVSPCKTEDVLKLKGGGDWHMSYLNFYRAKK